MRTYESLRGRLFRHDCRIAINTARATFAGWHDRLIAGTMLVVALAVVRALFADRPGRIAAWAAFGAAIIVGIGTGRLIAARIGFHSFDGLLAADALHPATRRRYLAACHGMGIAILAAITLIARPSLLIVSVPAYLAGGFLAHITIGFGMRRWATSKAALGWMIRRWLHQPAAGIAAAIILLLSLLPAHALATNALLAVVGIEAVLFALMLTIVDHDTVRFMSVVGYGPWRIVVRYAQGMLLFTGLTVPACWLASRPVAAGIVAAASVAMLLLLAIRVLAYHLHSKRFADLLVSILAGLLILTAYSMPVLLPLLATAILWWLQRRAAARTWLLA